MKKAPNFSIGLLILLTTSLISCAELEDNTLEKLPYFDLKGFIDMKIQEVDGADVIKVSKVEEKEVKTELVYDLQDWREEFDLFTQSDINKQSLVQSYDTQVDGLTLRHDLFPSSKGKVKFIKITYFEDKVSSVSIKLEEDNLFYSSTTLAEIYMNNSTKKIDHYSMETTQKIMFLDPNNMKINGVVKQ